MRNVTEDRPSWSVAPRLTIAYGTPRWAARSGSDAAGYTDSVDPSATTRSARRTAAAARPRSPARSDWPKLIVAALRMPPPPHVGGRRVALNAAECGSGSLVA